MSRKGRAMSMTFFISGNDVIISRIEAFEFSSIYASVKLATADVFPVVAKRVLNNQFRNKSSNTI